MWRYFLHGSRTRRKIISSFWSAGSIPKFLIRCSTLSMSFKIFVVIYILFSFVVDFSNELRLIMLEVPSPSYAGESIELSCIYELEQDKLYSVKWYKNDVEFYRYVPKDWPPGQFLPINGIRVDLTKSGMNSVFLKYIDISTAGLYRCEVSAEAPSFVTAEGEKELQVTVLPSSGPKIIGMKPFYKVGDEVNLTCISAKSKPMATLRWYINNKEVQSDDDRYHIDNSSHVSTLSSSSPPPSLSSSMLHEDNLETSYSTLRFVATDKHFKSGGAIRVKCTATVIRIHTMSHETLLPGEIKSDKYLDSYLSETLNQPQNSAMVAKSWFLLRLWAILISCRIIISKSGIL